MPNARNYSLTPTANTGLFPPGVARSLVGPNLRQMQTDVADLAQSVSLSVKETQFGATGNGTTDDTAAIQAAIGAATAASSGQLNHFYRAAYAADLILPAASYLVGNLTQANPFNFCHIRGSSIAELVHAPAATGSLLHLGNNVGGGVGPMRVEDISFRRADSNAGTKGLFVENISNGTYRGIATQGFDIGVHLAGAINVEMDFRRRSITDANAGILIESYLSVGNVRFAANLVALSNGYVSNCKTGVWFRPGAGVGGGDGGNFRLINFTFENFPAGATALNIQGVGEVQGLGWHDVQGCWFELYGQRALLLRSAQVNISSSFFSSTANQVIEIDSDDCSITLDKVSGYFLDAAPASGCLIDLGGTATDAVLSNIVVRDCQFVGLKKLHHLYPASDAGIYIRGGKYYIRYNSNYPAGNNSQNSGLALTLFDEVGKLVGPNWQCAEISFFGAEANLGCVTLKLYRFNGTGVTRYAVKDIDGNNDHYAITNQTASNATITFDGSAGHWYQMIGIFAVTV